MNRGWAEFLDEKVKDASYRELHRVQARRPGEVCYDGQWYWDFSTNDYMGLASNVVLREQFFSSQNAGLGSTGSRLLSGNVASYSQLEHRLEQLLDKPACLVFNSGYHANLGVMSTLFNQEDVVFVDKFAHASIIDGMRLGTAQFYRYRHQDYDHLRALLAKHRSRFRSACIVTESLFSMDGDIVDFEPLYALKTEYDCHLMIDEAHGFGGFGTKGLGVLEAKGVMDNVDILVGTFGKSAGGVGAFVAGERDMVNVLIQAARSFIYSTALPPMMVEWNLFALNQLVKMQSERQLFWQRIHHMCQLLDQADIPYGGHRSYIIPILVGTNARAIDLANRLQAQGFYARAIRYPTVPKGQSRVRLSLSAVHPQHVLEQLVRCVSEWFHDHD